MCVYSMVADWGRKNIWPCPHEQFYYPQLPQLPPITDPEAEKKKVEAFLKLLESAKKADEAAGQPDCEDPQKTAWLDALRKRATDLDIPLC